MTKVQINEAIEDATDEATADCERVDASADSVVSTKASFEVVLGDPSSTPEDIASKYSSYQAALELHKSNRADLAVRAKAMIELATKLMDDVV